MKLSQKIDTWAAFIMMVLCLVVLTATFFYAGWLIWEDLHAV